MCIEKTLLLSLFVFLSLTLIFFFFLNKRYCLLYLFRGIFSFREKKSFFFNTHNSTRRISLFLFQSLLNDCTLWAICAIVCMVEFLYIILFFFLRKILIQRNLWIKEQAEMLMNSTASSFSQEMQMIKDSNFVWKLSLHDLAMCLCVFLCIVRI